MNRRPEKPGVLLKWLVCQRHWHLQTSSNHFQATWLLFDAAWRRVEPALIEMIVSGDTPEGIYNPRRMAMLFLLRSPIAAFGVFEQNLHDLGNRNKCKSNKYNTICGLC